MELLLLLLVAGGGGVAVQRLRQRRSMRAEELAELEDMVEQLEKYTESLGSCSCMQ